LDVPFAVARGRGQDLHVILRPEMRPDEADRRQVQGPISQPVQDDRERARDPGRLDAAVRGMLGEPEGVRAVTEERPVALGAVELAGVEFNKVSDHLRSEAPLAAREVDEPGKEVAVRECHR
jgi:hypothetical protein